MQTLEQFGQTIKQKYPQYKDISDHELGQKMLTKYPQYKDIVNAGPFRGDAETQKLTSEGKKASDFLSQGKTSQIGTAFIKTLPKDIYDFAIEQPLKFGKSVAEASYLASKGGKQSVNLGGYVSESQKALQSGAKPFGLDAFVKPAAGTVMSGLATLGTVQTGEKVLSKIGEIGGTKRALEQTASSLSAAERKAAGARSLTGSKLTGVKIQPTEYEKDVAKVAKPFISKNVVKSENTIKSEISRISQKEILPQLNSSSYKLSQGTKTGLVNAIDNIQPLDITKADPIRNTAFNLFKERVKSAVANADNDKELFKARQILDDVANVQSGGKLWDNTGKMSPTQEFWRSAYKEIGSLLKKRNPQLGSQLDTQSKLFTALEGISEKTGKLIGKQSTLKKLGKTLVKGATIGAVGGLGGYTAGKLIK